MSQILSKKIDLKNDRAKIKQLTQTLNSDDCQRSVLFREKILKSKELIFLQSQSNIIEKTLGVTEKMKIRFECLVAHSPTVKVVKGQGNDFELNQAG
jgi:hypothetical protein